MAFFLYASFPNSRNRNRSPTRLANTHQVTITDIGGIPTLLAAENLNRTALTLKNTSVTDNLYYGYTEQGITDPTAVARFGLLYDLYFNTATNLLYVKTASDGISTNWALTTLQASGFFINSLQSVDVQSLQNVRAQTDTAAPVTPVVVDVDEGRA